MSSLSYHNDVTGRHQCSDVLSISFKVMTIKVRESAGRKSDFSHFTWRYDVFKSKCHHFVITMMSQVDTKVVTFFSFHLKWCQLKLVKSVGVTSDKVYLLLLTVTSMMSLVIKYTCVFFIRNLSNGFSLGFQTRGSVYIHIISDMIFLKNLPTWNWKYKNLAPLRAITDINRTIFFFI